MHIVFSSVSKSKYYAYIGFVKSSRLSCIVSNLFINKIRVWAVHYLDKRNLFTSSRFIDGIEVKKPYLNFFCLLVTFVDVFSFVFTGKWAD